MTSILVAILVVNGVMVDQRMMEFDGDVASCNSYVEYTVASTPGASVDMEGNTFVITEYNGTDEIVTLAECLPK